jgi:hypothetical protein
MIQVVELLPSKGEALSSNPSTTKQTNKEKKIKESSFRKSIGVGVSMTWLKENAPHQVPGI